MPASRRLATELVDRIRDKRALITRHVPLTAETTHLIDARVLARMRRSAYLVNTSRGPVAVRKQ